MSHRDEKQNSGAQRGRTKKHPVFYACFHCVSTLNKNREAIFWSPNVALSLLQQICHCNKKLRYFLCSRDAAGCASCAAVARDDVQTEQNADPMLGFFVSVLPPVPVLIMIIIMTPYPSSRCEADPLFAILATIFCPETELLHFQFACSVQHLRVKAPENDPKHRLDLHHRRARSAISEETRSRVVEPLPINFSFAAASPLKKKKKKGCASL